MSHIITSKKDQKVARSLGITESRRKQIEEVVKNVMEKNQQVCYTDIGEIISRQIELNTNEIFFLGIVIGSIAQFQFMVHGMISPEDIEGNISATPMPISTTVGMA